MISGVLKNLQIRHKLIILNLGITAIVIIMAGTISFITEYISFRESLLQNLSSQATIIGSNSTAALLFNDQKDAREILGALRSIPGIEFAILFDSSGSELASYQGPQGDRRELPVFPQKDGYLKIPGHLSITQGISLNRQRVGTIFILSNLDKFYALMTKRGAVTLLTFLVVLSIAYILLSKWQRVITEPILSLSKTMQRVTWERNYALNAKICSNDEIGELAGGFNVMIEQIQERDAILRKEIEERKRAEEEVRNLNEGLEQKVVEKTLQLIEAREELVRKEKLAILGQLSGFVSHELRNPLGVMNNTVFILRSLTPSSDKTTQEYLDILKHEIDKSERIIVDLLDFSRTKTPQATLVPAHELLLQNISECVIPENVSLQTKVPETLPQVKVDRHQIGQVIQNLITNGIQAMPDGGIMTVSAHLSHASGSVEPDSINRTSGDGELSKEFEGDFVEISVKDGGMGISAENMKKLFQPLFTTKTRGIGLGLTICKNLTEANGGRIMVESEVGNGAKFTILLPVAG
jgi:signal transduction histidine kinase